MKTKQEIITLKDLERIPCSCAEAIDKFIISTAIKNNSFHIQGSFFEKKTIHITYHGKLTQTFENINKNNNEFIDTTSVPNIYMYYCFDNKWDDKKIINMASCNKTSKLSYCANIFLTHKSTIYLAFMDENGNWDTDTNSTYSFKVYPDKEKEIIKRYQLGIIADEKKKSSYLLTIYGKPLNIYFKNTARRLKRFFGTTLFSNVD